MSILKQPIANDVNTDVRDSFKTAQSQRVLNIGVIGYGYWGPKLVRNFQELPNTQVSMVADKDAGRLNQVRQTHRDVEVTNDYMDLLNSDIDGVVIATPVSTHFRLAWDALRHGKSVLVEKPLARTPAECQALIDIAESRHLAVMVGHTFEYNPAVEMLKSMVASGELGRIYYVYGLRTNLGIFQKDINVLWDLAPHDISILLYVLGQLPLSVSANGEAYVQPGIQDVARMTLFFPDQVQAHVHVSWLDPCKVRRITIVGSRKMVVYDDVEPLEKLKVYDKGVDKPEHTDTYGEFQLSYRYGNITIPQIPAQEPLRLECAHFAESILRKQTPRSDGHSGLRVVKVLERAQASLSDGGSQQEIKW
jgi:predicted dehydrogenase